MFLPFLGYLRYLRTLFHDFAQDGQAFGAVACSRNWLGCGTTWRRLHHQLRQSHRHQAVARFARIRVDSLCTSTNLNNTVLDELTISNTRYSSSSGSPSSINDRNSDSELPTCSFLQHFQELWED